MHQVPEIGAGGSGARLFLLRYGPGALALALGTAASVGLFGLVQQADRNEAQVQFLEAAAGPLGDLRAAVESCAAAGRTLACAWGARPEARDEDFGLMAQPFLDQGLGIRAMAWVPRVAADRETLEPARQDLAGGAEAGPKGRAGLPISGDLRQGRPARQPATAPWQGEPAVARPRPVAVPGGDAVASPAGAGDRAESWPVRLVAAGQGEEVAPGTDLGADPVCLAALERAGKTGQPCATGRLSSAPKDGGPGRTIVFCPVYRQGPGDPRPASRRGEPGGFIAVYLSAADLVKGSTASPDFPDIEIRIYDNSSADAARLIAQYARAPSPGSEKVSGTLSRRVPDTFSDPAAPRAIQRLNAAGLPWEAVAAPSAAWAGHPAPWRPWALLWAGLGVTAALSGHFLLSARRKAKARPPEAQVRNARPAGWREEARTTIELTGLPDGCDVAMCLETALQGARQQQKPLALAIFSVDHLDEISVAQGPVFGDTVFRQVGRLLREEARPTDIVGRHGDDAYAAVWPTTLVSEALLLAERIRKRVAQQAISDGQRSVQASLSAGIAVTAAGDKHTAEDLIGQAEGALRAAQQSGHDCTKTSAETTQDLRAPLGEEPDVAGVCRQITSVLPQAKDGLAENLLGIVGAVDARDPYSKNHTKNVVHCVVGVAEQLGLGPDATATLRRSAIVHDIGNIGVPAAILSKAEALTAEERQAMQRHVTIGVHILEQVRILEPEVHILRHHHERWDGQGYPDGLAGETIPLGARILAVADAFDAITSDRAYRRAGDVADALQILSRESYRQFDANVVDAAIRWVRAACSAQGARDGGTPAADQVSSSKFQVPSERAV